MGIYKHVGSCFTPQSHVDSVRLRPTAYVVEEEAGGRLDQNDLRSGSVWGRICQGKNWRFPEMREPPVIHLKVIFPYKPLSYWGYPHDYGNPHIYVYIHNYIS